MKIVMDDGDTAEAGPGDVFAVEPGHDAWVAGHEPRVLVDRTGFGQYATIEGS